MVVVVGMHDYALNRIGRVFPVTGIKINGEGGDKLHILGFSMKMLIGGRSLSKEILISYGITVPFEASLTDSPVTRIVK